MTEDAHEAERVFADTLKIEASGLSPHQETQVKEYVKVVKESVERQYGKYFGPQTLEQVKGIEDRVITFGDKESFTEYARGSLFSQPNRDLSHLVGLHTRKANGDLSVVQPVEGYPTRTGVQKEPVAESWKGTNKNAQQDDQLTEFKDTLVHEIVHGYQDDRLPSYFMECAVPYYVDKVLHDVPDSALRFYKQDKRIERYDNLIKKYGESVHRLFFGSNIDSNLREKILATFKPSLVNRILHR